MVELADLIRPGAGRGLDFVVVDQLQKRTNIVPTEILKFAVNEMVSNALDTDATEIHVETKTVGMFDELTVRDNGSRQISLEDLKLILDFDNKASSKRGFLRISRGWLGNALKCLFGFSYALAEAKRLTPPEILVNSHRTEYRINLKPDRVREIIDHDISVRETEDGGFNSFTLRFPIYRYSREGDPISEFEVIQNIIFASSLVNPTRSFVYNLWEESRLSDVFKTKGELGESAPTPPLRRDTSILWYTPQAFEALFKDFMRARPDTQLKEFLALFRGFARKSSVRDILHALNGACNHDSGEDVRVQFVPSTPISELSDNNIKQLCRVMKERTKQISKRSLPRVLGVVGEEQFEKMRRENGWERLRYTRIVESEDQNARIHPHILELAVFDRSSDDGEGLKIYQCVNFMATTESLFSRSFDVTYRLGRVGIRPEAPVTVLIHSISPILEWLNFGKSSLYVSGHQIITKAFDKLLPVPKTPRVYRAPPPPKPVSWVPSGSLKKDTYVRRLMAFAKEIKAMDARRSKRVKYSSRGWCYLFEGLGLIDKGEFSKAQKAMNDCRKKGFLPIDFVVEDQDITRRFAGIHEAADPTVLLKRLREEVKEVLKELPTQTTDYWEGEEYYVMMCCEKGDIRNLFKPVCDEYHVPIVNSKGWYPILLRAHIATLSRKGEKRGLRPVLLLFYDHDIAGLKITETFRKGLYDVSGGTGWSPKNLEIYRFGLNADDIKKYGLSWIENLKTGSGKDPNWNRKDVKAYVRMFGRRKCESNALFKSDETLEAGEKMCRDAVERYYGKDALERFKDKEKRAKENLGAVYEDPLWKNLDKNLSSLILSLSEEPDKEEEEEPLESEKIFEVEIFRETSGVKLYYGSCPKCGTDFDYDEGDVGRTVRCRQCNAPMKLIRAGEGDEI